MTTPSPSSLIPAPAPAAPRAVILGHNFGAVRALRREAVPVAMIHDAPLPRRVEGLSAFDLCPDYSPGAADTAWADRLIALADTDDSAARPILFPASDRGLLAVAAHHEQLAEAYTLACPAPHIVETLIDKVKFALWAEAHGVSIPPSRVYRVGESLEGAGEQAPLPCIVKPSLTFRLEESSGVKLFRAHTPQEVETLARRCHDQGLDVALQTDLSLGESVQWSLAAVAGEGGRLIGSVLARKIRQAPWGAGTAVETLPPDARMTALAKQLCGAMGLMGLFEMEFRPDASGAPRVIEVNPRIYTQVLLPAAAGINLLHLGYLQAAGLPMPPIGDYRRGMGWISRRRDLRVSLGLLRRGELAPVEWLRSLVRARVWE